MPIFNLFSIFIKPENLLAPCLIWAVLGLSGCQPNESLVVSQANSDAHINTTDVTMAGGDDVAVAVDTANICDNDGIKQAFSAQHSKRQVKGCGMIIKALPDDNDGSRHQKILVELTGITPKQTLLLVHNIDLAPRVADVKQGDVLNFYGEYIYNDKGGLVHWTHHDPAARHQGGWIESNGVRYE